ncbi:MAG TPA: GNAT family N-acetyltransferase [Ktedonobacterales bacterium]|nr:GNAT family N-acetyltransferase [Ktedonobacterales bacterium]
MSQETSGAMRAQWRVSPAAASDLAFVVALDEESAAWLRARGFDPGEPPRPLTDIYRERLASGEVYLGWLGDVPVGMLTLQRTDPRVWPEAPADALYVHGLMVSRLHAGQRIGTRLLDWASEQVVAAGRAYLRLDCLAKNPALRAYYERAGFTYRGTIRWKAYEGARYERPVKGGTDATDAQ